MQRALIVTALTLLTAGCSEETLPETAEETITYALTKLVRDSDPGVAWDLLPTSYQQELQNTTRKLAATLPGGAYDKAFQVVEKLGMVLKTKDEDLLSFAPLVAMTRMLGSAGEDQLYAAITAIANVHLLIGKSEISSLQKLGEADLGKFCHQTGSRIWTHANRALAASGKGLEKRFESLDYKTIRSQGDKATVQIQMNGKSWNIDFTRVEGRWLPDPFVAEWKRIRGQLDGFLQTLASDETKAALQSAEGKLDLVLKELTALENTSSRSAFFTELQNAGTRLQKTWEQWAGKAW